MPKARAASRRKSSRKPAKKAVRFLHKANCTTCRKARAYLESRGVALNYRDLGKERLSPSELERLIGRRDHKQFLNPRNETYRRKKMGQKPPSRREAIRMMAKEPNLIRRPIVVDGGRVVVGFDTKGMSHVF